MIQVSRAPADNHVPEEDLPEVVLELEVDAEQEKEEDEEEQEMRQDNTNEEISQNEDGHTSKKSVPSLSSGVVAFGNVSIESLKLLPGAIHYYTSLTDYDHFVYVFQCLGPAAFHLKYQSEKLSPQDEFLLLLMKLRLNKDDKELSLFFGISRPTVGKVFKTWLNFSYFQLKELNLWPTQEVVREHAPKDFKAKFPTTRVILDGTECPIEKPSDPKQQSATWSSYKNRNTLKVLVGISPRGDVSHISEVYGGSTSDRQIVERSTLLSENRFEAGDSIMADRGFLVKDLFALKRVEVNVPTVMRGITQIPAEKLVQDRRIASKRVHVERVIGLAKTFRILKEELDRHYIPLGGRIIYVCFALTNFKSSVVSIDA